MRTASWLMTLVLLSAAPAFAQFTLTQSSFPATGSCTVGSPRGTATFDVGLPGVNRAWSFGDYDWEFVIREELVDAASSPFYAHFPTANRCVMRTGDIVTPYLYYRLATDGMYFLGSGSTDTVTALVSEARMMPFPCAYQTNWTIVIRSEWELFPGFHFIMTDSSLNAVDGWGTLNTPYGSNAALRVFTQSWLIGQFATEPPTIFEYLSYRWFSSQGEDLLTVTSEEGVTDPNFSSGNLLMTGVPQASEPVRGPVAQSFRVSQNYPNPFNPATTLPVELDKTARVTLTIYDETGRQVSSQEFELAAGHHDLPVNGANWAAGTYFARVKTAAQAQTVKMQLVK